MNRHDALAVLTASCEPLEIVEANIYGNNCRTFKNAPVSLRDLYQTTLSDETFVVFDHERYSFNECWTMASAIGRALVEHFAIQKGDRVAICMRNFPEWIIAFQSITSIGTIAVAMNSLWQAEEIDYGLRDSGCKLHRKFWG